TVGDPRGPTGSSGDLVGPLAVGADVEDPRAPEHDLLQVPDVVVVQARAEAEALAERKGDPPRTGSGPDQRETRQLQADRPRRRTLAEPGRAAEQEVVNGLPSFTRRLQEQCQLFLYTILPDELGERAGTERDVELLVFRGQHGCLGQAIFGGVWLVTRQVHHVAHGPTC